MSDKNVTIILYGTIEKIVCLEEESMMRIIDTTSDVK